MAALVKRASILLGRCMETSHTMGVEVTVTMRELDQYLLMYFNERYTFYAYDPKEQCKIGDILLIKKLPVPMTRKITHEVLKVVYPTGNVTDPITGKMAVVGQYLDEMMTTDQMFNRNQRGGYTKYLLQRRGKCQLSSNMESPTTHHQS